MYRLKGIAAREFPAGQNNRIASASNNQNHLDLNQSHEKSAIYLLIAIMTIPCMGQPTQRIVLDPPDTTRGIPVMTALARRASIREFNPTKINQKDLSDMVWAANGINRPGEGKAG